MSYVTPCNNSIVVPPVTLADVRQTILSLKKASTWWDDFPAFVAKQSIGSYMLMHFLDITMTYITQYIYIYI